MKEWKEKDQTGVIYLDHDDDGPFYRLAHFTDEEEEP